MASVIFRPPPERAESPVEVRVKECIYTFAPGVPTDVPISHLAAVQTALAALNASTVASPVISSSQVNGKTATRYFKIVTAGTTAPADSAPGTANHSAVCWTDADETITWTADGTELHGYKVLYSPDNVVPYTLVGTIAHGAALSFVTTPANIAAGTVYTPTANTASTSTITVTPNTASITYSIAAVTESADSIPGATTVVANAPATLSQHNSVSITFTPNAQTEASKLIRGSGSLFLAGTIAARHPQVAQTIADVGSGPAYTAAGSAAAAVGVGAGPGEI